LSRAVLDRTVSACYIVYNDDRKYGEPKTILKAFVREAKISGWHFDNKIVVGI
jgi:hypothetical protein